MKKIILFIFSVMILNTCALVPLSLDGDSAGWLKKNMEGTWVSLGGMNKIVFDGSGGFTQYTNASVEAYRGVWDLNGGTIRFDLNQSNSGGTWVDMAVRMSTLYHLYDGGKKFFISAGIKTGGDFSASNKNGQYINYTEFSQKTNTADSTWFTVKDFEEIDISESTLNGRYTEKRNFTNIYISTGEYIYSDAEYSMNVEWKNGYFTCTNLIIISNCIGGISTNIVITNNTPFNQYFYMNGASSEGISEAGISIMPLDPITYSNSVYEKK